MSSISRCDSDQSVGAEEKMTFENLVPAQISPSREDASDDSIEGNSNISSDGELSALELGDLSLLRPMLKWKIKLIRCVGQLSECRRRLIHRLETSVLNRQFNTYMFLGAMRAKTFMY